MEDSYDARNQQKSKLKREEAEKKKKKSVGSLVLWSKNIIKKRTPVKNSSTLELRVAANRR